MILHPPLIITARLLPGIRIGDSYISLVTRYKRISKSYAQWKYYIDGPDFRQSHAILTHPTADVEYIIACILEDLDYRYEHNLRNSKLRKWIGSHYKDILHAKSTICPAN